MPKCNIPSEIDPSVLCPLEKGHAERCLLTFIREDDRRIGGLPVNRTVVLPK